MHGPLAALALGELMQIGDDSGQREEVAWRRQRLSPRCRTAGGQVPAPGTSRHSALTSGLPSRSGARQSDKDAACRLVWSEERGVCQLVGGPPVEHL